MGLGAGLLSTGTTYAGLYLDTSTSRLFAVLDTGQAAALGCRVGQTLCAAALEACCSRELVLLPAAAQRVGHVDVSKGRIVLRSGAKRVVADAWEHTIDRYELESVATERRDKSRRSVRIRSLAGLASLARRTA